MNYYSNNYLMHHGVKGMKWGVRKDDPNPNYSSEQRTRDRRVYGNGGVRRINRRMNQYGDGVASARSAEASRINSTRLAARMLGYVGSAAGGIGGYYASKHLMKNISDPNVAIVASAAAASISSTLGKYAGQSLGMILGGYSPDKFRYE